MSKNFVINGELYVKNGPTNINDIIHDLEFETSLEGFDVEKIESLSFFQQLSNNEVKYDFSYTTDFWQLTTNGKTYQLNCIENYLGTIINTLEFSSKEELEKEFTSLYDFLNMATFVGKEFNRTQPIKSAFSSELDKSYMPEISTSISHTKYIVLYATQDLFLIKRISNYSESYNLINSRYTLDGNYKFHGKTYDEYRDKNKVYKEILEQIENSKTKRKKK